MTLQGFPTATTLDGISFVTTLPAPITVLSPIVTPGKMIAPAPIQQFLPICTGILYRYNRSRSSGKTGWPAVAIVTSGSNISVIGSVICRMMYTVSLSTYPYTNTCCYSTSADFPIPAFGRAMPDKNPPILQQFYIFLNGS